MPRLWLCRSRRFEHVSRMRLPCRTSARTARATPSVAGSSSTSSSTLGSGSTSAAVLRSQQAPLESEWNGSLSSLARVDLPHYIYESFRIANSTFYQRMFCFSGYASRREFWSFYFFWQFIPLAFALLFPICLLLFVLAFFPALGVTIRRLHDNDHSGWWVFVPCYALFYCLQSNNPENEDEYPED